MAEANPVQDVANWKFEVKKYSRDEAIRAYSAAYHWYEEGVGTQTRVTIQVNPYHPEYSTCDAITIRAYDLDPDGKATDIPGPKRLSTKKHIAVPLAVIDKLREMVKEDSN